MSASSGGGGSTQVPRSSGENRGAVVIACVMVPLLVGYCSYGKTWLRADRSESAESLAPSKVVPGKDVLGRPVVVEGPPDAPRYGELHGGAFVAASKPIHGFDLAARGYLWVGGLEASWLRLREPSSPTLRELDLFRTSLVGTMVAERRVELHLLAGVDVMHGREWTPAFGPGVQLRWYPARHLTGAGEVRASIFGEGYPLLDSRLDVGLVFGRLDVRVGGRWIFQAFDRDSTSILGPSVSLVLRLGP